MSPPSEKPRRATYADLEAVPEIKIAELIGGELYTISRLLPRDSLAASGLSRMIGHPLHFDRAGPGGWWILNQVEVHFPDPTEPGAIDALVPNIAGWRRERMPRIPDVAAMTLAPDWICEVVTPATEHLDREVKMPVYAREGVRHAWLLDPVTRMLEVYTLDPAGRWSTPVRYGGGDTVRAIPFDAVELDLSDIWD